MFGSKSVSTDPAKIEELLTRGVENVLPKELGLTKLNSGKELRVYLGIDPTGAKLHLGHTVALRKLKMFSELGHHAIFLVGSFTAMIGDPSGRDALREPLSREDVEKNFEDYKRQAGKVLDFSKVEVRYNHEWLEKLRLDEMVKLASRFTVQQLLQRDMFEKRIQEGKPIGLHEFLYPLMVGYDSVVLDVDCELGGSDQEFNILAGRHLQTALGKRDKFVLTTKLIEGTDGRKMSKSYNNCVYLDDEPRDMFVKLMKTKESLVPVYFDTLTDLTRQEIVTALAAGLKESQRRLAHEIVKMYHGASAAEKAQSDFDKVASGEVPDDAQEIPALGTLRETLVKNGVLASNSEFERFVLQNAIHKVKGADEIKIINAKAPAPIGAVFRIGKNRVVKIIKK